MAFMKGVFWRLGKSMLVEKGLTTGTIVCDYHMNQTYQDTHLKRVSQPQHFFTWLVPSLFLLVFLLQIWRGEIGTFQSPLFKFAIKIPTGRDWERVSFFTRPNVRFFLSFFLYYLSFFTWINCCSKIQIYNYKWRGRPKGSQKASCKLSVSLLLLI